jgi:type IV secretion system protein VirB11
VSVTVPRALISEAVNVIVFLRGRGRGRRVREIARVLGHDNQGYQLDTSVVPGFPLLSSSIPDASSPPSSGEPS